MKKLRTILLYKIILLTLFLTILMTIYRINFSYTQEINYETELQGIITNIKITDNKTTLEVKSKEKILVNIYNAENYKLGEKVKIIGTLKIPSNNTIFNLFNYRKYLKSKKINYIVVPNKIEKIENKMKLKYVIKNKIIEHINSYHSSSYLKTFLLGDSSEIDENVVYSFRLNGISHLFAVSGMHLSLFAGTIFLILKKLKIKELYIYIITILIFIFYAFLTNYSPSILRALLMYIVLGMFRIFSLKIKSIYILLIVLQILLVYNPFYVYNVGFLFSFTVSFFLILFSSIITNEKKYIKKVFITSVIAHTTSIPISINNFFEINIISPLINILFVPFVSYIIFPFSLLTFIIKPLDYIFLKVTNTLENMSLFLENINLRIILCHIPWYIVLLYYVFIILFIWGIKNKKLLNFLPLIILLLVHNNIRFLINVNSLTALDVNQGDSIILQSGKKNILIDTGGDVFNKKNIVNTRTIPYLKSIGVKKIDYLLLTHGDYDHMGEAINLVNNFKVEKVIFNCGPYNNLEKELIKVLDKKRIKYYSCIKELNINKNKFYFLQTKEYDNENDNSNVIYTELNGYKFMFMGDASVTTEKEIMDKYNLPNIDVLKVGHHGSKTSSSKDFINKINPKYSIISVGKNNRYGHPNKEVLSVLNNSKIYRTDEGGSIMIKIKNNKLKIETCSP